MCALRVDDFAVGTFLTQPCLDLLIANTCVEHIGPDGESSVERRRANKDFITIADFVVKGVQSAAKPIEGESSEARGPLVLRTDQHIVTDRVGDIHGGEVVEIV